MRIVSYDEADHDEVLSMNLQAFGWPLTEATAKKYLRHDERWMDILGVYAVERGNTIGQVLPLKIRTRTSQGEEVVGGIAGVTVVPSKARRGIATSLMKATQDIFRENDIRISFLLTSESLVAYNLYIKLGYHDAVSFFAAQKFVKAARKTKMSKLRKYRKKDWRITDGIYQRGTRGMLGFVVRQPAFLNMKIDTTPLATKNIRMIEGGEGEGYVVLSPAEEYVTVREIVCPNEKSFNSIMATIEAESAGKYVLTYFQTPRRSIRRLEKRGYKLDRLTWGRVMIAPIARGLSRKKLHELYDFGGSFCIMTLDTF
jgi:predicted acetyltransferase